MKTILALIFAPFLLSSPTEISYGSDPLQKLDLYQSERKGNRAVVVIVHGGGWQVGDKRQWTAPMLRIKDIAIEMGYHAIVPNYRLAPASTVPASHDDIRMVLDWVEANKAQYRFSGRVVVVGESAGANIGGVASVDGYAHVNGFIGFAGPYKIDDFADNSFVGTRVAPYLGPGCLISTCLAKAQQTSPYWRSFLTPSMLLVHGDADTAVPYSQSVKMAQRNGFESETYIVPGGEHTGPTMMTAEVEARVRSFLQIHLPF